VLRRLCLHNLFAREDKCEFHRTSVEFLRYNLSPEGLTMSDEKVKAIQDWPKPRKVRDIQSFLGFTNFYRCFIHDYSRITVPLTRLTRKGTPWHFSDECHCAFDTLKKAFTTAPVLTHWIPDAPLIVETDASDYALVAILAILSLRTSEGKLHPVAFHSRTFTSPKLNHDVHDKELLAIFEAFQCWRHYLKGSADPIDVVTDHKNLEYFSTTKLLTRRQACWSEYLSQFNLVICFRPGRLGTKPDLLTRRWDVYLTEWDSDYASINRQNLRPVFTQHQLSLFLRATPTVLQAASLLDTEQIRSDIVSGPIV
jgi:RNase H-like domain found in reverse transcriptase